jgi:hypothetical protein
MKRRIFALMTALAFSLASVLAGTPGVASAAGPTYTAVLSNNSSCQFGLAASWPPTAHVATVYAQWYFDGTPPAPNGTFMFTMQAPGTGPNAGNITGHTAVLPPGRCIPVLPPIRGMS